MLEMPIIIFILQKEEKIKIIWNHTNKKLDGDEIAEKKREIKQEKSEENEKKFKRKVKDKKDKYP